MNKSASSKRKLSTSNFLNDCTVLATSPFFDVSDDSQANRSNIGMTKHQDLRPIRAIPDRQAPRESEDPTCMDILQQKILSILVSTRQTTTIAPMSPTLILPGEFYKIVHNFRKYCSYLKKSICNFKKCLLLKK